jgi:acyl-CoA synthetase (AMP-forming)/AMP-acid ligase II
VLFVTPSVGAGRSAVRRAVIAACQMHLPVHLRPSEVKLIDAVPLGSTGKPDRDALRHVASASC